MPREDKERLAILETNQCNFMNEIKEIKSDVKSILDKIENLETKFVLRSEFKVAVVILSALATIIGIITYFLDK